MSKFPTIKIVLPLKKTNHLKILYFQKPIYIALSYYNISVLKIKNTNDWRNTSSCHLNTFGNNIINHVLTAL